MKIDEICEDEAKILCRAPCGDDVRCYRRCIKNYKRNCIARKRLW